MGGVVGGAAGLMEGVAGLSGVIHVSQLMVEWSRSVVTGCCRVG